jgi:hypothetical protein
MVVDINNPECDPVALLKDFRKYWEKYDPHARYNFEKVVLFRWLLQMDDVHLHEVEGISTLLIFIWMKAKYIKKLKYGRKYSFQNYQFTLKGVRIVEQHKGEQSGKKA